MGITIGSNIASLKAQRKLGESSASLSQTFERLSSGKRINKASDDAAGLAISESLKKDVRVYGQAIRNVNDGLSLLNIADSTVDTLSNILVRIRELVEQSANGIYSAQQRGAMDDEAQSLAKEFERVTKSAKFNGQALFDGTLSDGLRIQCGFGVDGSIKSTLGKGLGTGGFAAKGIYITEAGIGATESSADVAHGDLNGDGILDMVTVGVVDHGSGYQGQASVLLGRGDGTFGPKMTYNAGIGLNAGSTAVALGDVNGDGVLDLATAGYTPNYGVATVLLGRGDGTFGQPVSMVTDASLFGRNYAIRLGDVNGDGLADLATAGYADNGAGVQGYAAISLGRGDGTFAASHSFGTEIGLSGQSWDVHMADLNGDGALDLITTGTVNDGDSHGQVSVFLGRGDGSFQAQVTYATAPGSSVSNSNSLSVGDLNSDGNLDIVAVGSADGTGQATVFLGRGDGSFSGNGTCAGVNTQGGALGDANGDGLLDLVTVGAGKTTVLLGRGAGTFGGAVSYASYNITGRGVTLGDVDADGVLDAMVAGDIAAAMQGRAAVLLGLTRDGIAPILPFSLKTMADARQSMGLLDDKLDSLTMQRGSIGAFQSRLQVGVNTLLSSRENVAAAEGRITDSDISNESANLTRTLILKQAGSAVLAQANQQPSLALQLLS